MSKKIIKAVPENIEAGSSGFAPVPAKSIVPNWFKGIPAYTEGEKKFKWFATGGHANHTAKKCIPLLDSFTAGYVIRLENDINFSLGDDGVYDVGWRRGGDGMISSQSLQQITPEMIPSGYHEFVWKFSNLWSLQLPAGYSALYTHPLNRTELPFFVFSGVVDGDSYKGSVQFPFVLKQGFEGVIEAGTPIAQVIPFKREDWELQVKDFDQKSSSEVVASATTGLKDWYKRAFWNKKNYN